MFRNRFYVLVLIAVAGIVLRADLLLIVCLVMSIYCVTLFFENARLKKVCLEMESINRAKDGFLANMSQEIRTPMNAILGFSDMLAISDLSVEQRNHLKMINSSGQLVLAIINDILYFSNLEAGKLKMEHIDFDLEHLVYDVFNTAQVRFQDKQIKAYIDWDDQVPRWVKGDPTRLRQVILNLLGNAAKFTSRGYIGLAVALVKKDQDGQIILKFTVKDSGIGIAFTQADESTTRKYGGTGLGLAISKRIVEAMGGKLDVRSTLGERSEFFFTICFSRGTSLVEQQIQPLRKERLRGKKVLLVDDHVPSLEIIGRYCREMGLDVLASVNSTQGAMDAINRFYETGVLPDLVLSDIMMPMVDGYALAQKIRLIHAYNPIRIIAITSDAQVGSAQAAQYKGFDGFLPKPVFRDDLVNIIATVLGDKRPANTPIVTRHVVAEVVLKGIKVLVVDDSIPNQQLMKAYLDMFGCTYEFVNNGQEAVEKIRNDSYDLCLMDLQMPVMGGDEVTKTVRGMGFTKLPIIALTAAALQEDQQRCMAAGMNDYITKPVQVKLLKEKIIQWTKRT